MLRISFINMRRRHHTFQFSLFTFHLNYGIVFGHGFQPKSMLYETIFICNVCDVRDARGGYIGEFGCAG